MGTEYLSEVGLTPLLPSSVKIPETFDEVVDEYLWPLSPNSTKCPTRGRKQAEEAGENQPVNAPLASMSSENSSIFALVLVSSVASAISSTTCEMR